VFPIREARRIDPKMGASTIDSVRVLLQSLPAATTSIASQPADQQTPVKIGLSGTPLRSRHPSQLQVVPEKVEEKPASPPEEFWRDLQQFHERRG